MATLGLGPEARVDVRSGNGAKTKGYIGETRDSEFVVVNEKTGLKTNVPYFQVKAISGKNSATGAKFALSRGGGAATPLIFAAACIGGVILVVSLLLKGS